MSPKTISTPDGANASVQHRFTFIAVALLGLALGLAYANSFSVPLILDDWVTILHNPSLGNVWPPWLMFAPPEATGVGGRPVANATFVLNYAATGLSLRGLHVVNLAIHVAAALALFGAVRRTLRLPSLRARFAGAADGLALTVAALWALHPVQTESVTYVSQRTESLMGMFYFLTLYAFIRSIEGTAPRRGWQVVALISCAAGMATKEGMVTVPVMIFLYDAAFVTGSFAESWRRRRRFFLGLAASWLLLAALMHGLGGRGVGFGKGMNTWSYLMIEGGAIVRYLTLALWPGALVFDYGSDFSVGVNEMISAGLVALAVGWTIYHLTRRPAQAFLAAWFFVCLAPTSSVVPIPLQPISENRVYVPSVAIIVAIVLLVHRGLGRRAAGLFVAIALSMLGLTHARNADYRNEISIWTDTAMKRPANSRAHNNLGHAWHEAGRLPEARAEIEAALRLNPNYADAHANLASVLGQLGQVDGSIEHSRRALALEPRNGTAYYNLGVGLSQKGDIAGAIAAYEARLRLPPPSAEAEDNLAIMLVRAGRAPEAVPHAITALRLNPNAPGAAEALGAGLVAMGRFTDAVSVFETLLRQQPGLVNGHYGLGVCLAQLGRNDEAAAQFQTVLQLDPQHAPARAALEAIKANRGGKASSR